MIDLYYLSGSPYAWRVWLALEHKALPYKRIDLSFQNGDLRKDSYLAMNPRGKVPVIVDDGVVIYESGVILEYLDDRYGDSGSKLFGDDWQSRVSKRLTINELELYLDPCIRRLMSSIFFTPKEDWDDIKISRYLQALLEELDGFEKFFIESFESKTITATELSIFPLIALVRRLEESKKDLGFSAQISEHLSNWLSWLDSMPIFRRTWPPHWS